MAAATVSEYKMVLENSGFIEKMNAARESAGKAVETFRTVALGLTGLGGAFAAFQGAEAITEGLKGAIEQGRQFAVQARQTSQSVATLVELKRAFEEAGISGEGVTTALFMLNKALGGVNEEGQPTATAFERIGLSIAELKKQNAVEQFNSIIGGLKRLPDAAARANAAQAIFGRGARDIMAVLNDPHGFEESIAASAEYAKTMQQNAGAFEIVGKAVEQVQMKVQEFYSGVAAGLAPILEKVLGLINKIDFGKFGASLGNGIAVAFEAITDGKVFEIVRLGLTLAFQDAVNFLYASLAAVGTIIVTQFKSIPDLLRGAFSSLGQAAKGVGEILIGGILSQEAQVAQMFLRIGVFAKSILEIAVNAMGEKLFKILKTVNPLLGGVIDLAGINPDKRDAAQIIRDNSKQAAPYDRVFGADAKAGSDLVKQGTTDITTSPQNFGRAVIDGVQKSAQAALGAFQSAKLFDTDATARQLGKVFSDLQAKVNAGKQGDSNADRQDKGGVNATAASKFANTDADRLAKVGLFVGGAVQMPGLSEARRTADATEGSLKQLNVLTSLLSGPSLGGDIPRYL